MQKIQVLYDFIERAIKSRKYPENTGMALKTALKLFETELNEEERNSIDEFRKNINQIYQSVYSKNKNFSAGSLAVYKSRVIRVINDYEKYGIDPIKMSNWSPKVISRSKKTSTDSSGSKENKDVATDTNNSFHSFEFGGVKLLVPKTPKTTEAIMDGELKGIKVELKDFARIYKKKIQYFLK